jgi:uncharacterized UPF0160 family protein
LDWVRLDRHSGRFHPDELLACAVPCADLGATGKSAATRRRFLPEV